MDENLINSINDVTNGAPSTQATPVSAQPKKKKGKIIAGIILFVLIAAGATAATLYFMGFFNGTKPVETPDEEVTTLINEKINYMFGAPAMAESISQDLSDFADVDLFKKGTLTPEQKLTRAFFSLESEEEKTLTDEEIFAARANLTDIGLSQESVDTLKVIAYSGETVRAKYSQIFDEELEQNGNDQIKYNEAGDYFYTLDFEGFSTTSSRIYRKQRYTKNGDTVSVFISAAQIEYLDGNIYCDVFSAIDTDKPAVCASLEDMGIFDNTIITEENYATTRFDFVKNSDGKYIYSGAEIIK